MCIYSTVRVTSDIVLLFNELCKKFMYACYFITNEKKSLKIVLPCTKSETYRFFTFLFCFTINRSVNQFLQLIFLIAEHLKNQRHNFKQVNIKLGVFKNY